MRWENTAALPLCYVCDGRRCILPTPRRVRATRASGAGTSVGSPTLVTPKSPTLVCLFACLLACLLSVCCFIRNRRSSKREGRGFTHGPIVRSLVVSTKAGGEAQNRARSACVYDAGHGYRRRTPSLLSCCGSRSRSRLSASIRISSETERCECTTMDTKGPI